MGTLEATLLSILATFICAGIPFWVASRQLEREAKKLARISNLITRGLEEAGITKFNRDSNGEAIGLSFDVGLTTSAKVAQNTTASSRS